MELDEYEGSGKTQLKGQEKPKGQEKSSLCVYPSNPLLLRKGAGAGCLSPRNLALAFLHFLSLHCISSLYLEAQGPLFLQCKMICT